METRAKPLTEVDQAIVAMIRDRAARGETLKRIAHTSGIYFDKIKLLAKQYVEHYPNKWASPEQRQLAIRLVIEDGHSLRVAARYCSMSRSAVHRVISRQRESELAECGELQPIDGAREFSRLKQTWTCPTHGKVTLWPCVACAAIAARGTAQTKR